MTTIATMAHWLERMAARRLDAETGERMRVRVLDTLGCAIGALGQRPVAAIGGYVREFGGHGCTLIGGGEADPDRATLFNGACVRYLDFMDSFLANGETCHPSDNLAGVLAMCEYAGRSGRDFLRLLAIAYELQCRMTAGAPIMANGFDHTTQLAYSVAAGAALALGLRGRRLEHALAIGGSDGCSLAVIRAAPLSQWKGLCSTETGARALQAAMLAARGLTGPSLLIEGPKGFEEALDQRLEVDWRDLACRHAGRTVIKRHNAEVHSQTTLEAVVRLARARRIQPRGIERVEVEVFRTAYDIIGGGEFGAKDQPPETKEDADHNLKYLVAVALLDGEVTPTQFTPERLRSGDVRGLMRRVVIAHKRRFTWRYPQEMPARVTVRLRSGERLRAEQADYGALRDMSWDEARAKFDDLVAGHCRPALADEIAAAVRDLATLQVRELTRLLARVSVRVRRRAHRARAHAA